MLKRKKLIMLAMGICLSFTIGCDDDDGDVSTTKYNKLVNKYNDLTERYNAQTGRNVDGDKTVRNATSKLKELDDAALNYKAALEQAYNQIDSNQCTGARITILESLKPELNSINTKANELSQGVLVKALNVMAGDVSSYKDSAKLSAEISLLSSKKQMESGLTGIKSFASFTHSQIIDDYNKACTATKVSEETEVSSYEAPKESTVARDHGVSEDSVVTVDSTGSKEVISRDDLRFKYKGTYSERAYDHFSELAISSGGFLGFSPTAKMFANTVNVVLENIISKSGSQTDIAIVLDTTASMSDDIDNVKRNMKEILAKLNEKSKSIGLRLSLILYRDKNDDYITKVVKDFTDNITSIDSSIQSVTVDGGGDTPEAVIDALAKAMNDLSWRPSANRSVILIGDAQGHPTSRTSEDLTTSSLIKEYKKAGLGIIVYPILVNK